MSRSTMFVGLGSFLLGFGAALLLLGTPLRAQQPPAPTQGQQRYTGSIAGNSSGFTILITDTITGESWTRTGGAARWFPMGKPEGR